MGCAAHKPLNFINWLFSAPHCSLLHKISSCTKFGSIIPCIVVEGVSRTAAGSVLRSLWQFFSISSSLNYAVVLDTPLVCCIYFFSYWQHLRCFRAQFSPLFLRKRAQLCFLLVTLFLSSSYPVWQARQAPLRLMLRLSGW